MAPRLKNKDKLLPIFHQGEDFKWLDNMLEYTDENGKHIPYIGISPANDQPVKYKREWLRHCFDMIAKSSNPNVKTHAFGMTSLDVLEDFPFTSADSTSWLMSAVTGSIFSPNGPILVSSVSNNNSKHFDHMLPAAQESIREYVKSYGFTIEELAEDYKKRQMLNIMYMNNWASNYKYTGGNKKINTLFNMLPKQ